MLPPLPQFFAEAGWYSVAAFSQKFGGEGWGEGATPLSPFLPGIGRI
jgi:hypothetical protein